MRIVAMTNTRSVLTLDDEVRTADGAGEFRLLPRELELRLEFLGHVHAVGHLEADGAFACPGSMLYMTLTASPDS